MDPKRHSTSGRPTASKPNSGINDLDSALSRAVGSRIRVTTTLQSHTIEGSLFAACTLTNLVAINTSPAPPNPSSNPSSLPGNYHIIPVSQIQRFEILAPQARGAVGSGPGSEQVGFVDALPPLGRLDIEGLRRKEAQAIAKMREFDATRGKGVTREAQEIFDHFHRQFPSTRWDGTNIIVSDSVIIKPPYGVENCRTPKDKQQAEEHIKRVLEGYYNKKRAAGGSAAAANSAGGGVAGGTGRPVPATPFLPRKGG